MDHPGQVDLTSFAGLGEDDGWSSGVVQNAESTFDWNLLNDFYYCSSDTTDGGWPNWTNWDVPAGQQQEPPQSPDFLNHQDLFPAGKINDPDVQQPCFANVTQWLDGSYRPPHPCSYCYRHRLQCLTIRTTEANPNPVTACSSCVALFRECSLAQGEKRQPSGFETLSPVMGHLHGVTELTEDGIEEGSPTVEIQEQKESKQFVRKGARILREWFHANQEFPYPSEEEKCRLSRETGFSKKRLSTWFANARRRHKQKLETCITPQICRTGSPMPISRVAMTPMERWQASPPEDEAVPESVIQHAVASSRKESGQNATSNPFLNAEETASHFSSSASSLGSRHSEVSSESVSSAWSYQSTGAGTVPFPLLPTKSRTTRKTPRKRLPVDEGPYQCTFCTQTFKKKHDWFRHEKSVHLQLDSWVCTPDIKEVQFQEQQGSECRFCDLSSSLDHWEDHEFYVCAQKPVADRSFSRKDYLWQHLRKFHGCTKVPIENLDIWRGAVSNVQSRCGFCNMSLPTWTARADHLADHFKKGCRMSQWVGDWGLDAFALGALRNAVPPSQRCVIDLPSSGL